MWRHPGARMGSVITLVFFAWWAFNTMAYFATLYYQQVKLLSAIETSLHFIPMAVAGFSVNVITGYAMGRTPGHMLILLGLIGTVAAPLIFALIDVDSSYWAMMFLVMIFVVGADVIYPVGNLHIASTFGEDSQSLAGGVFNVATRIGTSIGLAVTSSIATAISEKYASAHPALLPNSPEVLMVGFRAAGWTCFTAAMLAFLIGLVGLRGIGVVGQRKAVLVSAEGTTNSCVINISTIRKDAKLAGSGPVEAI
ncbi:hypothetical protein PILCRDRAFT_820793 [Piloderma croceum F 1598]|uniref:Major facilitator superfamily (MFS) profile domain-containing protein n=1 Tax=Piloderma croceum (strain F 1598) TaxID=765440 RepID=A0A0C3B6Q2_PILCF|nr:hypothetical protein PILCRDRAFT_820793 [Piloderma croceum F 1598]